jgi:hypothetical protein
MTDRLRRSKGLFESMYQSRRAQVLAHFAKSIHTLSVNDLPSRHGEVERLPTMSRTTGTKFVIEIFGRLRSSCILFPSSYPNGFCAKAHNYCSWRNQSEPKS